MLDCKPDKLAQNAPSQSEAQEARQASQGVHKQTSYPRVQWDARAQLINQLVDAR